MATPNENTQIAEETKPTLEGKYGHQPSAVNVDDEGRTSSVVNVMDELLVNKKPLADIIMNSDNNVDFQFSDPKYYIEKYSKEANPLDTEALPAKQIMTLYQNAKTARVRAVQLRDKGVDLDRMKFEMEKATPHNSSGLLPTDSYGGNINNMQKSYKGFYDPQSNSTTSIGTNEEIAMENPYMIQDGKIIANPGKEMMDEIYGNGKNVITTVKDPSNGRDMFQVLPSDSFVPAEQQYSTKWGPKETFGNAFIDFSKSVYSAAGAGTMKSFSSIGALMNDTFNYDENHLYKQGTKAVMNHIDKAVEASLKVGNLDQAEQLRKAQQSLDPKEINDALNNAYSSMPSSIGQSLRREAQPLDWGKGDKALQAVFNEWNQAEFKQSLSTQEGAGVGKWMGRQGPTVGYLLPQIAIGMASGGGSMLAQGMVAGARKMAVEGLVKYVTPVMVNMIGTSQAFSSFERAAQENGVSPGTIAKYGWYALPLTYITEHFTNKWIGDQMAPNLFGKAMREVYAPMAKKMAAQEAAGTLTDKGIKDAMVGGFKKVFNSKFVKSVKESDGYFTNIIRANVSETIQENTENELYQFVQRQINAAAPSYYTEGNGKFANSEFGSQIGETTLGTLFATTLMTAVTGIVPKIIRQRTGQPEPTTRAKAQEMLKWDVLKNGGDRTIEEAIKENAKDVNIFGNKNIKAKDSFIDGTYTPDMMTVPQSPTLQKLGYKEGQEIDNFAEMHFVELIAQVDAYKELNASMGLNDLDRQILSSAGFDDEISLNKSADAYVAMQTAKKEYESIQDVAVDESLNEEDKQKAVTQNELNKKPALDKYNAALKQYQYYTTTQEGTNNSEAVNDMVKRNVTYMKQVEMAMTDLNENQQISKEQKNDPNFQGRYKEAWNKVIKEQYTYQKIEELRAAVEYNAQTQIATQNAVIDDVTNRTTATNFNTQLDELSKRTETLNVPGQAYNDNDHKTLVRDIAALSNSLAKELTLFDNYSSTMNNTELEELAGKYKSLYDSAAGVTTRINENDANVTNESTNKEIEALKQKQQGLITQEQIDAQTEIVNNASDETLLDETNKLDALIQQYKIDATTNATLEDAIDSRSEGLVEVTKTHESTINNATEELNVNENFYAKVDPATGKLSAVRNDILEREKDETDEQFNARLAEHKKPLSQRSETQEQFDARIEQLMKENTPNGKSYLGNYFQEMKDDMVEANVWIESVLNDQGKSYKEAYPENPTDGKPKGQYYGSEGAALIKVAAERVKETLASFKNTFKTANAIHQEERVLNHQTQEEKDFLKEIGSQEEDGLNSYQKTLLEASSLSSDVLSRINGAALANKKARLHTRVIIHENTHKSVGLLVSLGLKNAQGNPILSPELVKQFQLLTDIPQEVLDARGNISDPQIKMLAERESVVNNVLSALTVEYNKDSEAFMSEGNKNLLFEIFDDFYAHNNAIDETTKKLVKSEGTIMWLDDASSHIGVNGSKTNETREIHASMPLFTMNENGKRTYNWSANNTSNATRLREHMNVIMWIGSKYSMNDIFNVRKNIFKTEQSLGLETGEQESAVNTLISVVSNKQKTSPLQAFKERYEPLHSGNVQVIKNWLSNAITVGGDYGTGKTQFVAVRALKILQLLDAKTKSKSVGKLTLVSITDQLQAVHSNSFGAFNPKLIKYTDFIEKLNEMPVEDGHTYIIDEASIISSNDTTTKKSELTKIEEHFVNGGAKVIFLGDVFQMRDADSVGNYPISMFHTMTTHMLTEQFSATSPLLRQMAEESRKLVNVTGGSGRIIQFPNVTERIEGSTKNGARYYSNQLEVWNAFVDTKDNSGKRAIIFMDKAQLDEFTKDNKTLLKQVEDNKENIYFAVRRQTDPADLKLLQGLRQEEIYVTFNQHEYASLKNPISQSLMASALYTAIGRAGGINEWVGMIGDTKKNVTPNLAESIKLPAKEMNAIQQVQSEQFRAIEEIRFNNLNTDNNLSPLVLSEKVQPTGKSETTGKTTSTEPAKEGTENGITHDGGKSNVDWVIKNQMSGKTFFEISWDGNKAEMIISSKETNKIIDNQKITEEEKNRQKRDFFRGRIRETINEFSGQEEEVIETPEEEVVVPVKKKRASKAKPKEDIPTINPINKYNHKGVYLTVGNSYTSSGINFQIESIEEIIYKDRTEIKVYHILENGERRYSMLKDGNVYVPFTYIEKETEIPNGLKVAFASKERFESNSTSMFISNSNSEQSVFWGTSATLVGLDEDNLMTTENKKIRRSLNDAIMSQFQYLSDNGFELYVTRENNTAEDRETKTSKYYDMVVVKLYVEIVTEQHIEALKNVLKSSYAWKTKAAQTLNNNSLTAEEKIISLFSIEGMNDGVENMAVGSMSLPSIATMGQNGFLEYKSFDVFHPMQTNEERKTELSNKWDSTINGKYSDEIKSMLRKQKEMNLSLFDMHNNLEDKIQDVLSYYEGIRHINYTDNESDVNTIQDFLDDYPGAVIAPTPLFITTNGKTQLRLKVEIGQEELSLVVRMPKFSDILNSNVSVAQRAQQSFDSIKQLIANDEILGSNSKNWKELQNNFRESIVYKLLRGNMSIIQSLPVSHPLKQIITINGDNNEFIDLKSNLPEKEKGGDILNKFKSLKTYLSSINNLIEAGLYDYLSVDNSLYGSHLGVPIIDILNIAATGMNNKSFYLGVPNSEIINTETVDNETPVDNGSTFNLPKTDDDVPFEETKYSSPDVIAIDDAIKRVARRLGDTYVSSQYFNMKDGKIMLNDGRTANGMVIRNAFMTLSQEDGLVNKSTPEHEVFHIVYRNFVSPEMQTQLQNAVRTISNAEKGTAINSLLDAEEWMARDYAKQERVSDTGNALLDFAINTWNSFKAFMKGLVTDTLPIYHANKTLKSLYSKINAGEFVDRVSEIKPQDSETVLDETNSESSTDEQAEQSTNEKAQHRLTIATTNEAKLISELNNKTNLVRAKNVIKMTIMQNSLYSNTKIEDVMSFNDSVNKLVIDAKEMQKLYGQQPIIILATDADGETVQKTITVKEFVSRTDNPNIAEGQSFNYVDQYRIYTDTNIRTLVQVMLPSYDMMKDSFDHETGAGERFDWDGYSSEQNISAIQKLYLSTIPRIDVNGNPIVGKAPFLDQKEVHSMLIDLGMQISQNNDTSIGKVEQLQNLMLAYIEQGSTHKVQHGSSSSMQYMNEAIEKYHSIYNYMFEARGQSKIKNYELDYNNTYFTGNKFKGKFKGLLERTVENEMQWRKDNIVSGNELVSEKANFKRKMINDARMNLHAIVATYTSMNIKNQVIATYYNDTMKFTHLSKELWRVSAEKLKSIQNYDIQEGELKNTKINFMTENVQFNNNNISVLVNKSSKFKTPFLNYENGKFKFVTNDNLNHATKKVGKNIITSFTQESLERDGNLAHIVNQFERVKGQFGLKEISPVMFKSMLLAKEWNQVTDTMRTINTLGHTSNFNSEIVKNYLTPADFLADYLGNMLTMYNQYAQSYRQTTLSTIDGKSQSTIEDLNVLTKLQYYTDEKLTHRERIESIPGSHILLNYLKNSTPSTQITFEVKGEMIDGVEQPVDPKKVRYISPEDMWVSTNMIASMIQKVQNKTNDTKKYNAEGKATYSVALSTTLNDELNKVYQPLDTDEVKINAFVESIGENRSLGFTSIGKTKIDTADFIDNSINLFMQEMVKGQRKPMMYVPTTTVADTGKIVYAKVESTLISTNNGFKIDFTVAANEILREYDKKQKQVNESRATLQGLLFHLKENMGYNSLMLEGENDTAYHTVTLLKDMKALSLEAHANGTFAQLKKFFDNTDLVKSDNLNNKLNADYFDIVYKTVKTGRILIDEVTKKETEEKLQIIQPGNNITNNLSQYDYDYEKPYPGQKSTRYIDKIRELNNLAKKNDAVALERLENAIMRVYQKDYEAFTDMAINHNFNPVQSMNTLTENSFNSAMRNPVNLQKNDNPFYQNIPAIKKTATTEGIDAIFRYNQPMFGYYLATMFTNNRLDDFSLNPYSFKSVFDKSKRNGPLHTPSNGLLINETTTIVQDGVSHRIHIGTLPTISAGMFYRDNEVDGGKTFQMAEVDGKMEKQLTNKGNSIEPENGQADINPFHYKMTLNSIGGTDTVIGTASMFKGLLTFRREDGSYSEFKRGDKVITGFDMQHDYYKNKFMRMLSETDFRIIDNLGIDSFVKNKLSFTVKFIELYNDKQNLRDFEQIIDTMMDWIYNQQFYQDQTVKPEGIEIAGAMYKSIVAFIAPVSTQKAAVTRVNDYHALQDMLSTDVIGEYNAGNRMNMDYIDNSKTKIVMNPSQDVDVNNKLQAAPSQQDATGFGVTNNNMVSAMYSDYMQNKQDLQKSLRKNLEDAISDISDLPIEKQFKSIKWANYPSTGLTEAQKNEIDPAIKQFQKFMRTRVVNSLRTSGQDLAFIELFNDENVSLQLPMMRSKVIQAYRNLTNQAVQGKVKGLRLTQTAGEYIDEYVKDGMVFTKDDVLNNHYTGGKNALSFEDYYSENLEQQIAGLGYVKQKMQDMEIVNNETTSGHIVMPNIYAKIYGHRSNESMVDIQQIRIGDTRAFINQPNLTNRVINTISKDNEVGDWMDIIDSPMVRKAIKNLKLEDYVDQIINSEPDEKGHVRLPLNIAELLETNRTLKTKEELNQLVSMNESILDSIDAIELESTEFTDKNKKNIVAALMSSDKLVRMVMDETALLLKTFEQSNEAFLSRVPATFLGSGGVFKTVMFHNGGNVVYIPTGMINRNDADFDIDALTMYANSIDRKGHLVEEGSDGYRNKMNSLRNEITLHSSNQESLFLTSSLKKINDVTEKKNKRLNQEVYYNNSVRSLYETYSRAKAGADAIGILANTLTVSSTIVSGLNKGYIETGTNSGVKQFLKFTNDENGKPVTGLDSFVIELGTWQQGALDNNKNNTFANYAISPLGINILGVLKLNNKTNEEIYDFFNNYEVRQLFDAYSGKTSIMTKSSDFNLYKLAVDRALDIRANLDTYINSDKSNVTEYLLSKGQVWNTKVADIDKYQDEIKSIELDLKEDFDDRLLAILQHYQAGRAFYDEYDFNGTSEEIETNLNQWKKKNGMNDFELYSFKNTKNIFDDNSKMLDIKEFNGINSDEIKSLRQIIKARANINFSKSKVEGLKYMEMIPKLSVTADALYRISTIMGMRKGLPTMDREFNNIINNVEQYIGMSLKDYMSYNDEKINIEKHVAFFMANNDVYNKMKDSTVLKPTDKQFLIDQEKLIANEINIAKFVKNNPQLDFIIRDLYRQQQMIQQMFIQDSALVNENITKAFLKTQNRTNVMFGGEMAQINTAINDVLLDNYYNSIGDNSTSVGLFIQKTTSNTYQNPSRKLDLNSLFDRQSFVKNFPEFMMSIQENSNNIQYLKQTFKEAPIDSELMKIENNALIKLLNIGGKFEGKLRLDVNLKEMTEQRVAFLHDEFKKLPREYQTMLTNYELIANRMGYSNGSLMQVIGVDFFKDKISEVYNKTFEELRSAEGMNAFIPERHRLKGVTFEGILQHRIFDSLGLKPEFSQFKSPNAPTSSSPKYVHDDEMKQDDTGQAIKTGRTVHYRLNDDNEYEEYSNITSLGISADPKLELTTELKVFAPTAEEEHYIDLQLEHMENGNFNRTSITHKASIAWVNQKVNKYLFTRNGVLVLLGKVDGANFDYKIANLSDISKREKERRDAILAKNNRIELAKNTLQYDMLSPVATDINGKPFVYKVRGDKFLNSMKINTISNDGKLVSIPVFGNKESFENMQDVLDTFKSRLIQSVGSNNNEKFRTSLNQFTGNTDEERRFSRSKYLGKYMYGLIGTANMVDENGEPTVEAKQARVVRSQIIGKETLLLKHLMDLRIKEHLKTGKMEDITSTNFIRNKDTTFNNNIENIKVGKSTYGMVVRTAIVNSLNPNVNLEMRNKELERSNELNTLEGSLSLWNKETKAKTMSEETSNTRFYDGDITPSENTVFVFGSNPIGVNGNPAKRTGGAALVAHEQFGVQQGEIMNNRISDSGNAYGLTTVVSPGKKLSMSREQITNGIRTLYDTANQNPEKQFKVAFRNINEASLNGYTGLQMIDMFNKAGEIPSNVIFSREWGNTGKLNITEKVAEKIEEPITDNNEEKNKCNPPF